MAERDFEELLKTISRINTELDELNRKLAQSQKEISRLDDSKNLDRAGSRISRLENAISTRESERNRLQAEALREASTNRTNLQNDSRIKQTAREIAQNVLQNMRDEMAKGLAAANKPVSPGLQKAANLFIQRERSARSAGFRSSIFPELYEGGEGGRVTTIPRPLRPSSPTSIAIEQTQAQVAKAIEQGWVRFFQQLETIARNQAIRQGLEAQGGGGRRVTGTGTYDAFTERVVRQQELEAFRAGRLPIFNKEQELDKARRQGGIPDISSTERAKEAQERLNRSLRARIAAEDKYRQALEQAQRLGFNVNDLRRVQTRGTAGIEQLQFERMDESGINRRFDTYVNPNGKATPGISNQFRSFGQGVVRDIGELTKWSLALAAVYGPLRKLQELTQIMIENQSRLAEATTSVSSAFIGQDEIFNAAADAAERAGESIDGVIDAFTQAYRAAGGGGDEVERFATAQTLLNDSLLLSKLSTLDQASAIDTLSAALRQTTGDLTSGSELLDKWVRVTKVANVDLASLATGFAVLGDAAESAGLDADQLNGILAAIGETGIASGRELANTARAVVGLFQSDQAREALERIGVAVVDTTGKARPFLDILKEIDEMQESGVLSQEGFSQLTLDIGQGVRRQAQVSALISSQERIGEVAKESANASGDAQAALAKQLETVQTALTRLQNAFQELAQTMGTEGGFLGIITGIVNGMTSLVRTVDDLVGLLGKATPAMLAFVAATAALKYSGKGSIQQALTGVGEGLARDPVLARLSAYGGAGGSAPALGGFRQFAQNNVLGTNAMSGGVQGLAVAALPAIMNFMNKDDRFGNAKGGLDLAGGIAGGIIGSLTPVGPVIGSMIGVAAAEAFANATISRKTEIFGYTAPTLEPDLDVTRPGDNTNEKLDENLRRAEIAIYEGIGNGSEALGRTINSLFVDRTASLVEELNKAIEAGDEKRFQQLAGNRFEQGYLERAGITQDMLNEAFESQRSIQFNPESLAYQQTTDAARRQYDEAAAARAAKGGTPLDESTAFARAVQENNTKFSDLLQAMKESTQNDLRQQRITGDIRGAEYGRKTSALSGFDTRAVGYYTALGDQVDLLTGGADDAASAFQVLNNVIIGGSEEALPQLTTLKGEIETIVNMLDNPKANEEGLIKLGGITAAQERLGVLRQTLGEIISDINQEVLVGRIQVPNVEGDVTNPLSTPDLNLVKKRATSLQDEFYQGFLQIPDDMYEALKSSWEEWAQIVEDSGDVFYERISEIDPQFFQQAMQQLLEENKLKSQEENPFGIQQVDMDSSRAGELQNLVNYFTNYLSQNFPQYQQNPEDVGIIFNDYVTSVLHGDNLAIKLALEKIVDLNQKQLDGMYNIPEGATFWVPLTAAYYRPQNNGTGGGMPAVDSQAVDGNTSATEQNTMAVSDLTLAIYGNRYDKMNPMPEKTAPHEDRYDKMNTVPRRLSNEDRYDMMNTYTPAEDTARNAGSSADRGAYGVNPWTALMSQLQSWLSNLINQNSRSDMPFSGRGSTPGPGQAGGGYGANTQMPSTQVQPVQARLEIQMDNTTQLVVDGRILASIISPYLAQEMVRLEASQGTITRRFVI